MLNIPDVCLLTDENRYPAIFWILRIAAQSTLYITS